MASGSTHDRLILITTPIVAGLGYTLYPAATLPLALSYLVGGLWLSPDLDTPSKPFHRWRSLKLIWLPYQKLFKHRGVSHWLIVGTLSRLLYLAIPAIVLGGMAGIDSSLLLRYGSEGAIVFVGLELSAWTHLAADGLLFK